MFLWHTDDADVADDHRFLFHYFHIGFYCHPERSEGSRLHSAALQKNQWSSVHSASSVCNLKRLRVQFASFFGFLVRLAVAGLHLSEGQIVEDTDDGRTRSEIDSRLLDERVGIVFLSHRTF